MKASITIYPYDPFPLENGITFFNFQNKVEYSQLLFRINKLKKQDTLVDDPDRIVHFYTNPKKILEEKLTDISFIGDLTGYNLNSTPNIKYILKKILHDSPILREKIENLNVNENNLVFEAITAYDSEINFDPFANFEKLLKAKEIRIDDSNWQNYCDKITSIVGFYSEFTSKKLLLFHNLERLLSHDQLNELNDYLKSLNLLVISLESFPMTLKEDDLNVKLYSIDEDHVRFDY